MGLLFPANFGLDR